MQKYLKLTNNIKNLKIRYANIEDLHFVLKLHNQNVLKDNFFSKQKVSLIDHKIWFKKKINEKNLFIGTLQDKIGYVRYDFINKKKLSVSIAIKDKYKRKGFGKQILTKTLKRKKITKFDIFAVIKKQNQISKKFFLSSGFKFFKKKTYVIKAKR
jgi:L-amino acid N-acyltransferase YncA